MNNARNDVPGWWAILCAVTALAVCAVLSLTPLPMQWAVDRLRVGMTTQEVARALEPEIHWEPKFFEGGFTCELQQGLSMTFTDFSEKGSDYRLVRWKVGPPHPVGWLTLSRSELEDSRRSRLGKLDSSKVLEIVKRAVKNKGELREGVEFGNPIPDKDGSWDVPVWITKQSFDQRLVGVDSNGKVTHYWYSK